MSSDENDDLAAKLEHLRFKLSKARLLHPDKVEKYEAKIERLEAQLGVPSAPPPPEAMPVEACPMPVEAMSLDDAVQHLYRLDEGRRLAIGQYSLNKQGKARYDGSDTCPDPLFESVDESAAFWRLPTVSAFTALLDNYERATGEKEVVTREERREIDEFLDAVCATPHAVFALTFLKTHGKDPRAKALTSMADLKGLLKDIWFSLYRRWKPNDSSGFEHVFVGEESRGKITGLHNWLQYYLEEKKGTIDYVGYTGRQDRDRDDDVELVTIKFAWADDDAAKELKPLSTILVGATPEFELAALTLAFLCGEQDGDNRLHLGRDQQKIKIVCHPSPHGDKVGTAYIEVD
mmetsp:Transcript_10901/g.32533  ORF Transcript_10901/g.32533 Transcript_10901/m.32533 type:complete len:348 (-) Transcript_10901:65-1108(-)|eukprot:CAMPEP_0119284240 /NCGR_PEP_ID=MMETSP1329-20130426/29956_1 /TAXON_ID=114041 /ORGANISM="Genus nov. species nov., Strain RCC1024" /LENGTH=347 /DNA_ID=CAMNT_0007284917 /DNA_START=200 /DNA_END=1243 /DNA_ORIENTATION=-